MEPSFLSTSTDREVAEKFIGADVDRGAMLIINSSRGKDISQIGGSLVASTLNNEKEILYPPGSVFKVTSINRNVPITIEMRDALPGTYAPEVVRPIVRFR